MVPSSEIISTSLEHVCCVGWPVEVARRRAVSGVPQTYWIRMCVLARVVLTCLEGTLLIDRKYSVGQGREPALHPEKPHWKGDWGRQSRMWCMPVILLLVVPGVSVRQLSLLSSRPLRDLICKRGKVTDPWELLERTILWYWRNNKVS